MNMANLEMGFLKSKKPVNQKNDFIKKADYKSGNDKNSFKKVLTGFLDSSREKTASQKANDKKIDNQSETKTEKENPEKEVVANSDKQTQASKPVKKETGDSDDRKFPEEKAKKNDSIDSLAGAIQSIVFVQPKSEISISLDKLIDSQEISEGELQELMKDIESNLEKLKEGLLNINADNEEGFENILSDIENALEELQALKNGNVDAEEVDKLKSKLMGLESKIEKTSVFNSMAIEKARRGLDKNIQILKEPSGDKNVGDASEENENVSELRQEGTLRERKSSNSDLKQGFDNSSRDGSGSKAVASNSQGKENIMFKDTLLESTSNDSKVAAEKVNVKELPKYIENQIKASFKKGLAGQREIKINLNPEHLGKITLKIVSDASKELTVKIFTENKVMKEFVEQNLNSLKSNLETSGIKSNQIEVDVASEHGFDQFYDENQQSSDSRNQQGKAKKTSNFSINEEIEDEDAITDQGLEILA